MLFSIAQAQVFFLIITRVFAILVRVPFMGGQSIPNQVKVALGIALGLFIYPWQNIAPNTAELPLILFAFAILKELLIGTLVGFVVSLFFSSLQITGILMEFSAGFSAGQIFNPTLGAIGASFEQIFEILVLIYFLTINGHHVFILGLAKTFEVLPVNSAFNTFGSPDRMLAMFSAMIVGAFQMAMPVMGAILLADISLGLLSKVSPQIQVYFLGLPVKIWLGIVALSISLTILIPIVREMINNMGIQMLQVLGT